DAAAALGACGISNQKGANLIVLKMAMNRHLLLRERIKVLSQITLKFS
ncbi:28329_t:CDS:1, partial [Racocetra persica]